MDIKPIQLTVSIELCPSGYRAHVSLPHGGTLCPSHENYGDAVNDAADKVADYLNVALPPTIVS